MLVYFYLSLLTTAVAVTTTCSDPHLNATCSSKASAPNDFVSLFRQDFLRKMNRTPSITSIPVLSPSESLSQLCWDFFEYQTPELRAIYCEKITADSRNYTFPELQTTFITTTRQNATIIDDRKLTAPALDAVNSLSKLDYFVLEEAIGEGTMNLVFRCYLSNFGRNELGVDDYVTPFACKVGFDDEFMGYFGTETTTLMALNTPGPKNPYAPITGIPNLFVSEVTTKQNFRDFLLRQKLSSDQPGRPHHTINHIRNHFITHNDLDSLPWVNFRVTEYCEETWYRPPKFLRNFETLKFYFENAIKTIFHVHALGYFIGDLSESNLLYEHLSESNWKVPPLFTDWTHSGHISQVKPAEKMRESDLEKFSKMAMAQVVAPCDFKFDSDEGELNEKYRNFDEWLQDRVYYEGWHMTSKKDEFCDIDSFKFERNQEWRELFDSVWVTYQLSK